MRHAAASGTLSRDSRPYPHDRYALPLRLISHWKPASPQFRGRLTPEVGDDMEGARLDPEGLQQLPLRLCLHEFALLEETLTPLLGQALGQGLGQVVRQLRFMKNRKGPSGAEEGPRRSNPSRTGTKHIGGCFPPEVAKQLRQLAVDEDTSHQKLFRRSA